MKIACLIEQSNGVLRSFHNIAVVGSKGEYDNHVNHGKVLASFLAIQAKINQLRESHCHVECLEYADGVIIIIIAKRRL